jgi:hypothetical protein
MSRSALRALDRLDLLNIDSLVFISDEANEHALGGTARSHGLEEAADHAPDDAIGLEIAVEAPVGTPDLPDHPGGPSASIFEISSGILLHQPIELAYAKPSGTPGGGKGGGNDDPPPPPPPPVETQLFGSVTLGETDADGVDYYNITIEFYGDQSLWGAVADGAGFSGGFLDAFLGSAEFLTSMIMYGYADSQYLGSYKDIEAGLGGELRLADDLVIEAYLTDIDGVGGILGRAGPYDLPPTAGLMEFDTSDAANLLSGTELGGLWDDVVLHEMMHVLGFGTLWGVESEDPVPDWGALVDLGTGYIDRNGTKTPRDDNTFYAYNGDAANGEALSSGTTPMFELADGYHLAVERDGGAGTAGGHWDEVIYDDEIMTGYINSNNSVDNVGANYLADFTVAAFADLGYVINGDYDQIAAAGTEFLATGEFTDWA